mgnify:CR=1 FL=1
MPKMSVTECVKVLEEVKSNWEGFISEYPKSIDPDAMFALNFAISALKQQEVLVKALEQIDLLAINDHYLNTGLHFKKINDVAREALASLEEKG